jgi:hypothetical protein
MMDDFFFAIASLVLSTLTLIVLIAHMLTDGGPAGAPGPPGPPGADGRSYAVELGFPATEADLDAHLAEINRRD